MRELEGLEKEITITRKFYYHGKPHILTIGDLSDENVQKIMLENREIPIKVNYRFKVNEKAFAEFKCNYRGANWASTTDNIDEDIARGLIHCCFPDKPSEESIKNSKFRCDALVCPRANEGNFYLSKEEKIEKVKDFLTTEEENLRAKVESMETVEKYLSNEKRLLKNRADKLEATSVSYHLLVSDTKVDAKPKTENEKTKDFIKNIEGEHRMTL